MKSPIRIERREKPEPVEPKYKWLLPLLVVIAIAAIIFLVIYAVATGRSLV